KNYRGRMPIVLAGPARAQNGVLHRQRWESNALLELALLRMVPGDPGGEILRSGSRFQFKFLNLKFLSPPRLTMKTIYSIITNTITILIGVPMLSKIP